MATSVSIVDIPLIIDSICQGLSLRAIQTYRRVNKKFYLTFGALPNWLFPPRENRQPYQNKSRVRSLAIDGNHNEMISTLGFFTTLQDLVLSDDNYGCFNMVGDEHFISLINNNPYLQSLEINQHQYRYWTKELFPALLFAITRHPSLTKLKRHVHGSHGSNIFTQCLLYACHRSIQ